MRPTEPRLLPLSEDEWDDESAALMRAVGPLNIFATLARHPKLLKRWMVFGAHVLAKNTLADRDRELAILRTGWRCEAEYEFGQHTAIGRGVGLTDDDVRRTTEGPGVEGWTPAEVALLTACDDLHDDRCISDATWAALTEHYDERQIIDLIFTVGQYQLVSMALNSLGVQLDDGYPGFPEPVS